MRSRLALLATLLGLSGCGGAESAGGDAPGGGGPRSVPGLELWGYLRNDPTGLATEVALGPLDFDSIRQSTGKTHALVHVSGFT